MVAILVNLFYTNLRRTRNLQDPQPLSTLSHRTPIWDIDFHDYVVTILQTVSHVFIQGFREKEIHLSHIRLPQQAIFPLNETEKLGGGILQGDWGHGVDNDPARFGDDSQKAFDLKQEAIAINLATIVNASANAQNSLSAR